MAGYLPANGLKSLPATRHFAVLLSLRNAKWSMGGIKGEPLQFQHITDLRKHRQEVVEAKIFTDTMREFAQRLKATSQIRMPLTFKEKKSQTKMDPGFEYSGINHDL